MNPVALVYTALLLGLFVLAAGGYGGLYAAGRLWSRRGLLRAAFGCYFAAVLLAAAICLLTPLAPVWKAFVVLSGAVYAAIPPVTWRYLDRLHRSTEGHA